MSKINYVYGVDLVAVSVPCLLLHVCNDQGGWGAGFSGNLSKRYPATEAAYRGWGRGEPDGVPPFMLGYVLFQELPRGIRVGHMLAQQGFTGYGQGAGIRYWALRECFKKVVDWNTQKYDIVMPRIGCGLGGGRWDEVEYLIKDVLIAADFEVSVYDFRR